MTTPIADFRPKPDQAYLVYLPDLGGWQVGEFITIGEPARWVLMSDASVEIWPTHVAELPPNPVDDDASDDERGT